MSVVFGLSMCMARGNKCTFGNENDLQGLLFGGQEGCGGKILIRKWVCE